MNQETLQNEKTIFDMPLDELSDFQQGIRVYAEEHGLKDEIVRSILYIRYIKNRKL